MLFSASMRNGSAMATFELPHEGHQRRYALRWHGVVDAGTHAADGTVPLEIGEARLRGFGQEGLVQLGPCQRERHVHDGTEARWYRIGVETAAVDGCVEFRCLAPVAFAHGSESAQPEQPAEHQPRHVPA